jgi:hypothetical protein
VTFLIWPVICGWKTRKSICQQASPGFPRLCSGQALRLRAISRPLCDRSARRFAQDDGFVGGENHPASYAENTKRSKKSQALRDDKGESQVSSRVWLLGSQVSKARYGAPSLRCGERCQHALGRNGQLQFNLRSLRRTFSVGCGRSVRPSYALVRGSRGVWSRRSALTGLSRMKSWLAARPVQRLMSAGLFRSLYFTGGHEVQGDV